MSVVVQSRASVSNGKTVGVYRISAEILKILPWRALQKIRYAFELRYKGQTKQGRSAPEIATAIWLMAAAAQEWRADLGLVACSMDVKQDFDIVSPESLRLTIKETDIAPMLAGAILSEQLGGRYDICFQETRVTSQSSRVEKIARLSSI